jgi:hypothetical protein
MAGSRTSFAKMISKNPLCIKPKSSPPAPEKRETAVNTLNFS